MATKAAVRTLVAGLGVAGSIASVVALFPSLIPTRSLPAPPAPVEQEPSPTLETAQALAPETPENSTPEPRGPEPLRLPPISNLLFSEARELLLRQGWFPISSPVNPTGNEDIQSGNGPYFVEKGYREVTSCSGSGLAPCRFAYRSEAGQILHLVTVGEDEFARVNDLWIER